MPKTEQDTWTGAAHVLLVVVGCIFGFLLTEGTYRLYLYQTQPSRFLGDRNLWYFQDSPFRYSEEFGFEYIPGKYVGGAVYEGKVTQCWDPMLPWVINERGNMGRIKGSYEHADLKILVFGDSVTAWARESPNGALMSWPDYLQDILEERLKKSVHVVNFARDGYGILQMFDLAAVKVPEWRPDIVIIAFITDDFTRDRFWRMITVLDGGYSES